MSQSVAQKTSISEKTWRRQTDSPSWWIAFSCGSVILHLLAFWLIGSYKLSSSQQQRSQSVPIEFIEISPQKSSPVQPLPKPLPKPVTPKPSKPIVPQNSQPAIPRAVKPPVTTNDRDAIAFNNQKIERQLAQQQQQKLLQQRQLEAEQLKKEAQRQREEQQTQRKLERQQQLEEQQTQRKLERQQQLEEQQTQRKLERQQQLEEQQTQRKLERQQQLEEQQNQQKLERQQQREEQQTQRKLERQQQREEQQNPADGEKIADAPTDARGLTPPEQLAKAPQAPIQNQPTQSGGILTATWKTDTNTFFEGKPDNLAKPKKRSNSEISLPPPEDGNFQPRDFLVWLTIDNQGNLLLIKVDESIPVEQRSQYQEYAEKIFNGQKFIPASENNGNKPDFSYLPVRVNIQSALD